MKTHTKVLLVICLAGFVAGLSNLGSNAFSGLARAVGAIFFCLFFITWAIDFFSEDETQPQPAVRQTPAPSGKSPIGAPITAHAHA